LLSFEIHPICGTFDDVHLKSNLFYIIFFPERLDLSLKQFIFLPWGACRGVCSAETESAFNKFCESETDLQNTFRSRSGGHNFGNSVGQLFFQKNVVVEEMQEEI